ncbi:MULTISPECIES: GNAT family N-acetyltransferase [Paenibacillus]|uniref:GNAT family N-acetyltransferase n=1 Tax=Paenibacillus xylanilyticus TaxID=248903 RepID=A0A7Y6C1T6_9BACL|nr:GNAT family N-acetyltransferase [Paenibacillus xylanilyticus]NUU78616.1 GNAT family N-acetyltransferase [Paenibacillus xylanilyticus]
MNQTNGSNIKTRDTFLETERLEFSTWSEEDRPLASALWGDPEVTKWISRKGFLSEDEIEARLAQEMERQQEMKVQYWPLFDKETGVFVGCCGLRPYAPDEKIYELGVHLTRDHWGKGYALEASKAVIRYAFEELDAHVLFAGHHPENSVSRRLLLKLGFIYKNDEFNELTGKMHPSYILTRSDMESLHLNG